MKFSLILGVFGHHKHDFIRKLITSLERQKTSSFELIIVDQNPDDQILKIFETEAPEFRYKYLKSQPGLSRGRNMGLKEAVGEYIAFPDDDCEYPDGLLQNVLNFFKNNSNIDLLAIDTRDTHSGKKLPYTKKANGSFEMSARHIFKCVTSISIFGKRNPNILFDERLGLGAEFPSCEEFDFVTSYFLEGKKAYFTDAMHVLHPDHANLDTPALIRKIKIHAVGHGAYFKKHFFFLFPSAVYNLLIAPIGGMIKGILLGNKRMFAVYWTFLNTRFKGFYKY